MTELIWFNVPLATRNCSFLPPSLLSDESKPNNRQHASVSGLPDFLVLCFLLTIKSFIHSASADLLTV